MSNQARSTWSRNQLTNACLGLLKEKPIEEITISELCSKAGTGRVTFYRNYQDINDIVFQYLLSLNKEWTDELKLDGSMPLSDVIKIMLQHFEKHREFYAVLSERHLIWMMKDVIMSVSNLNIDGNIIEAYSSAYVIYILYGWIEVYFQRGMKDSSEELYAILKSNER